jgi:small subunit ribosomal protein S20
MSGMAALCRCDRSAASRRQAAENAEKVVADALFGGVDACRGWGYNPGLDLAARHLRNYRKFQAMAQHKSAEKRARQTKKRTAVNRARRSKVRTAVKSLETAIASGDKAAATVALKKAQPALDKSVSTSVAKKRTASRKLSRLNARVKAMA